MSLALTEILIVLGFVSFPTKQGSSGLPEKALGRAGDVEVRSRETAAGRQCLWHEALCGQKLLVKISVLKNIWHCRYKVHKTKTDLREKFVLCNLVESRSICWVTGEHAGNELPGCDRQGGGQRVASLFNTAICLLKIIGLKWRFALEQSVPA